MSKDVLLIKSEMNIDDNLSGCHECICRSCLLWWSSRCPYGSCYDDHMAEVNPYDKVHPGKVRKGWTNWNNPGEQAHWCRGGTVYAHTACEHYVEYEDAKCKCQSCLKAVVEVFQDGYIKCSLIDIIGCEQCYKEYATEYENE